MKKYKIYQVDSFTRTCFHGNPAGVVPDADGLSEEQMQRIAREMNNSETAFIFPSNSPDYDVEVRFFTPTTEVPICGHATVAAHYVYALEKNFGNRRVRQKTKAGILPVDIVKKDDDYSIVMTQGTPVVSEDLGGEVRNRIADALGISTDDICREYPVAISSTGHSKVMVPICSNQLLHSLKPDLQKLTEISSVIGCNGYYVFTLNPGEDVLVHGRMFVQNPQEKYFDFSIMQGEAIQRDGTMRVHVEKENGKPVLVQITGDAVVAFSAEINIH